MHHTKTDLADGTDTGNSLRMAAVAWVLTAIYYFYQYALRSAPSVMVPQLSEAFGVSALGVASIVGLFYYGYSPFSLVAGATMDRPALQPRPIIRCGTGVLTNAPAAQRPRVHGWFGSMRDHGCGECRPL